jgi:hypothetical protein
MNILGKFVGFRNKQPSTLASRLKMGQHKDFSLLA